MVRQVLAHSTAPVILDADGINAVTPHILAEETRIAPLILTPHPGEMARLTGAAVEEILASPVEYAQQLAQDMDCCVLLKGATTVIVRGEDAAMNVTGCDAMGTGGCGDVLTGVIAGLMAQGMTPLDAARAGAFYHGLAGETAAELRGSSAVTAWYVCEALRIE